MFNISDDVKKSVVRLQQVQGTWGRVADRTYYSNQPPDKNPDPIDEQYDGERYFKISNHFAVKAGLYFRDVSRLFVSARGLEPNKTGAYFPPQLIYTQPDRGNQEQFDLLAEQYDEKFEGGFAPILRSLQQPAMMYGRAVGEIDWQRDDNGKWFVPMIWSRDSEEYLFSPPDYPPGIYKKNHTYSTAASGDITRMPDGRFLVITFDPLYNNPYGQSIERPIAKIIERWESVFDDWTVGLKKAALGSWIGEYGPELAGESDNAKAARALFLAEIGKIANGTHSIFDERNNIRAEKLQFEAQAFLEFHNAAVQATSVLFTGSATALSEGKYGSYAAKESTDVREKSDKEQEDAMMMGLAFTYQFNQPFLHFNFANVDLVPQLQLIQPERIMPTTPEGQETQVDDEQESIEVDTEDVEEEQDASEFQEEEEEKPVVSYPTFPSEEEEPPIYFEVEEAAKDYLDALPVKDYNKVQPSEAPNVFTIKALRGKTGNVALMTQLKFAIKKTIPLKTEAEAWEQYIKEARSIFQTVNIPFTQSTESELIISFRQARQSAYQSGIDRLIDENIDNVYGIRIVTREDREVRTIHKLWHNVVLTPDDPRVKRLRAPMDMGCRCNQLPVYQEDKEQYPLTPENKIPKLFPGESYKNYVGSN